MLDAVAGLNVAGSYGAYRRGGVGRRAYDPAMEVALLLYCYSRGVRSARAIERACRDDVACRVIAMLEAPDHATLARFVYRHEQALGELFGQVLGLCDQAGLVRPGVVAIDGTRLAGNASRSSDRDFGGIAREILAEATATDEAEDELYGDSRGDELSEQLRTREGRQEFFARRARNGPVSRPRMLGLLVRSLLRAPRSLRLTQSGSSRAGMDATGGRVRRVASLSSLAGMNRSDRAGTHRTLAARRAATGERARRRDRGQPGL